MSTKKNTHTIADELLDNLIVRQIDLAMEFAAEYSKSADEGFLHMAYKLQAQANELKSMAPCVFKFSRHRNNTEQSK